MPIVSVIVLTGLLLLGQAEPAGGLDLHEKILRTYDFSPHLLDAAGRTAKAAILDDFWADVKASGSTGLDALRSELSRTDTPAFFAYDGAKLLLSLGHSRADKELALASFLRCDLRDIETADYFYTVHSFAVEGLDTTAAALRILVDPKWQVFVPQHVLTLGQNFCLIYLLLPLDESVYLERIVARLDTETDPTAMRSLVLLLAYSVTPDADSAILRFASDPVKDAEARAYALTFVKGLKLSDKTGRGIPSKKFLALKAERRKLMHRISDEALIELDQITRRIRAKEPS